MNVKTAKKIRKNIRNLAPGVREVFGVMKSWPLRRRVWWAVKLVIGSRKSKPFSRRDAEAQRKTKA